jgi:hypothetical protein
LSKTPTFLTILDEVKKISITKLKELGYLKPECYHSDRIVWSINGEEIGSINLPSDMRAELPILVSLIKLFTFFHTFTQEK